MKSFGRATVPPPASTPPLTDSSCGACRTEDPLTRPRGRPDLLLTGCSLGEYGQGQAANRLAQIKYHFNLLLGSDIHVELGHEN